mgnify:CR=1 FL=1
MSVCKYKFLIILIIVFLYLIYLYKNTEGFNDDFSNYSKTLPNSFIYNSARTKYNDIFSFYKGKGVYKREKLRDAASDEKISILNKLLDKLLNRISSDSQDCVGDFGKYSECDKLCGSGGFQTRKYVITQEKGINGKECPYEDGYEENITCFLKDCGEGGECERNRDCRSRNCDPKDKKCGVKVECTKETTHVCDEDECRRLNEEYSNASHVLEGKYLYNKRNKQCFFKTPAEMEKLNVNLYTYNYENPDDYTYGTDECAYYQTKGEKGICENRDKINLVDKKPKCLIGWKPEPTLLNKEHACKICNVPGSPDGQCDCPPGKVFDEDGNCGPGEDNTTKICNREGLVGREIMIQPDPDNPTCHFCEYNEYFYSKSDGDNTVASCYKCQPGMITNRALNWDNWSNLELYPHGDDLKNEYLEPFQEGGAVVKETCDIDICSEYSTAEQGRATGPSHGTGTWKQKDPFQWAPVSDNTRKNALASDKGNMCAAVVVPTNCDDPMADGDGCTSCIDGWERGQDGLCESLCVGHSASWISRGGPEDLTTFSCPKWANETSWNVTSQRKYDRLMCGDEGVLYGVKDGNQHLLRGRGDHTELKTNELCKPCGRGEMIGNNGVCTTCEGTYGYDSAAVPPDDTPPGLQVNGLCVECESGSTSVEGVCPSPLAIAQALAAADQAHLEYLEKLGDDLLQACPPGHSGECTLKAENEACDSYSWPVKIWENDVLINPSQTYNHQLCTSLPSCSHRTDGIWYELGQPTDSTTGTCSSLLDEERPESYCNSAFMAADPAASETERQKSGVYYQCLTTTVADTTFGIQTGTTTHCKTYMPGELSGGGSSVCGHPDLYI